jgi:hypothetical protein
MGVRIQTVGIRKALCNPVLRAGLWTGQTHPLSALGLLNSTALNAPWTKVLVRGDVESIDYPQIRRHNPACNRRRRGFRPRQYNAYLNPPVLLKEASMGFKNY